jgi:hypothetical protein
MKKTWAQSLGSVVLATAALAWGIRPAAAQITPKQPRASGAGAPAVQMRSISNSQRKLAAEALAAKRTGARTRNATATGNAGYRNTRDAVSSSNEGRQNSRPRTETR